MFPKDRTERSGRGRHQPAAWMQHWLNRIVQLAVFGAMFAAEPWLHASLFNEDDTEQTSAYGTLKFKAEYFRNEMWGFFPYLMPEPVAGAPFPKYTTETWRGTGNFSAHPEGQSYNYSNLVYAGSWSFSKDSFDNSISTKTVDGYVSGSYNVDGPYHVAAANYGLETPPYSVNWGSSWGPNGTLENTSATTRQIVWPGPLNASTGWNVADLHETLTAEFSKQQALARGTQLKKEAVSFDGTVKPFTGSTRAISVQFWDDYYPKKAADVTSRTQPVTFSSQRASVHVAFNTISAPGKYDLTFVFNHSKGGVVTPESFVIREYEWKEGPYEYPGTGEQYASYQQIAEAASDTSSSDRLALSQPNGEAWQLLSVTADPAGDKCASAGDSRFELNSVEVSFSMGQGSPFASAGELKIVSPTINASLYTVDALTARAGPGVQIARASSGIRQVDSPQGVADVQIKGLEKYEINFYSHEQAGEKDPITKLYSPTGTPFAHYLVENPDPVGTATRLKITKTINGTSSVNLYYREGTLMRLSKADGLELWTNYEVVSGASTTKILIVSKSPPSNAIIRSQTRELTKKAFGTVVTSETGFSGEAYHTLTYYEDAAADGVNYGRVKTDSRPDGSSSTYRYDLQGRIIEERVPLDSVSTPDSAIIVYRTSFALLPDQDGDGLGEKLTTCSCTTKGTVTAIRFKIEYSRTSTANGQSVTTVETRAAASPSSPWNDSANLVSRTRTVSGGFFDSRILSDEQPDGTLTLNTYSLESGDVITVTESGAHQDGVLAVNEGRRVIRRTNATGNLISEETRDIATGLVLSHQVVTARDFLQRPTRIDYDDGSFTEQTYACCGLSYFKDRNGQVETYTYDALGRQTSRSRNGITILSDHAANGLISVTTRKRGTDGSEIPVGTETYTSGGELAGRSDALGRTTTYARGTASIITTYPGNVVRTDFTTDNGQSITKSVQDGAIDEGYGTVIVDGNLGRRRANASSVTLDTLYVDFLGRPFMHTFGDGSTERSTYNAKGQLVKTVDADGVTTLFGYNASGEQDVVCLDLDRDGLIGYGTQDRITRVTHSYGSKTDGIPYVVRVTKNESWEKDNEANPTITSVVEESLDGDHRWMTTNGLLTQFHVTRDRTKGNWDETTTSPDGVTNVSHFENSLRRSTIVSHPGTGLVLSSQTFSYDPFHRISAVTDGRTGTTSYTYFDDNQIKTVTTPDPDTSKSGVGYDPQTTSYTYDSAGRLATITLPDGGVVTSTYHPTSGLLKRQAGARTTTGNYTYDSTGRLLTLTTEGDIPATTSWDYDAVRGWPTRKRYADGKGPTYEYTAGGRLKKRSWARTVGTSALSTAYTYGYGGDLVLTDYSDDTPDVALSYDRLGRPITVHDAAGLRTLNYHSSGQLSDETYSGVGLLSGRSVTRTFDLLDRLTGVTASSTTAYAYDAASRIQTVTSGALSASYGYVPGTNLISTTTMRNSGAVRLTRTNVYDNLNRLASTTSAPSAAPASSFTYAFDNANQRTRVTREDSTYWEYTYDPLGQLTSGQKRLSSGTVMLGHDFAYTYDGIGNRRTDTANGTLTNYTANALNQYTQIQSPPYLYVRGTADPTATVSVNGQIAARQGEVFARDAVFDAATTPAIKSVKAIAVKNHFGPAQEDLVKETVVSAFVPHPPETLTYDSDGNLTSDARWIYAWDAENRLTSMETAPAAATAGVDKIRLDFAYDSIGRRIHKKVSFGAGLPGIWKTNSDTGYLYDGWNLAAQFRYTNPNGLTSYIWGLDVSGTLLGAYGVGGLIAEVNDGSNNLPIYDGTGNIQSYTSGLDGSASKTLSYDPFGNLIEAEWFTHQNFTFSFSTKYTDSESGLIYFGFRYYDTASGKWISRDPIEENGGANLQTFVGNSPQNLIDPSGLALYAFDGTSNNGPLDFNEFNETNVYALYNSYAGNFKSYAFGVGTRDGALNNLGLAFGYGGKKREKQMLSSAIGFIKAGDFLADITGFSRGAASARDFANRLNTKFSCVTIRWIGLFDTVAQIGLPNDINVGYDLRIPKGTGRVLHLTAGAERRTSFPLTSIRTSVSIPNPNQSFVEETIPDAVHSDVGGGYGRNRGLGNQVLQRMWRDGINHGVPFGPLRVRYTNVRPNGPNDSRWMSDRVAEYLVGQRERKVYYHP